jgi:predicted ATPase
MRIESIELRNYRQFRHVILSDLPQLAVVVGANGSGKTTLLDALGFLRDSVRDSVAVAVAKRGGLRELRSRGESGPVALCFTLRDADRIASYRVEVGEDSSGIPVVQREVLELRAATGGSAWDLVDMANGAGHTIANWTDMEATGAVPRYDGLVLSDPSVLAIKGLGQFREFKVVADFRAMIEKWHIFDFHIGEARHSADEGYAEHLSPRGENIAQFAKFLYERHRDRFDMVLDAMKRRVPGIDSVEARTTEDGRLVLRFRDGKFADPFIARFVSDGTIKMFAYLLLLHDPNPHPLLAVEEPENQLYPSLLAELVEEFRAYGRDGGQVFVSTHSPDFLNAVELEEIFWLSKRDGFTSAHRASESELLRNLVREGDRPGALWNQGLFEGVDPQ